MVKLGPVAGGHSLTTRRIQLFRNRIVKNSHVTSSTCCSCAHIVCRVVVMSLLNASKMAPNRNQESKQIRAISRRLKELRISSLGEKRKAGCKWGLWEDNLNAFTWLLRWFFTVCQFEKLPPPIRDHAWSKGWNWEDEAHVLCFLFE